MPIKQWLFGFDQGLISHPERVFIFKALVLVTLLALLHNYLFSFWIAILLFAPIFVFYLVKASDIHTGQGLRRTLLSGLTFFPVPYVEKDSYSERWPVVTIGLIMVNVAVYYLVESAPLNIAWENWVFVPEHPTFVNVLFSLISSAFLHASQEHLWGNMLFLWAFGSVVERRVSSQGFLVLYLSTAVFANLFEVMIAVLTRGDLPIGIGASGAISGVMGIYAVRCYFKTMVFPFPVLGLFSFLFPLNFKIRMNALVLMGLYFWGDLSGGLNQLAGSESGIAYWCHVGGMVSGIMLAMRMDLGQAALTEKHLDTARDAMAHKNFLGTEKGEESLRAYLVTEPDDPEAQLLLAQHLTSHEKNSEGHELYQRAIQTLLKHKPQEALLAFRGYFNKHYESIRPELQFRMAILAEHTGDPHFASRCLEALLEKSEVDKEFHKKCLFHCQRLCRDMGFDDAAEDYMQKYQNV